MDRHLALIAAAHTGAVPRPEAIMRTLVITASALALVLAGQPLPF